MEVTKEKELAEKILKEVASIEKEAKEHYRKADEYYKSGDISTNNKERELGNALMKIVTNLKQIIY